MCREQIGVGVRKAPLLIGLDDLHSFQKGRRGCAGYALFFYDGEMAKNGFDCGGHDDGLGFLMGQVSRSPLRMALRMMQHSARFTVRTRMQRRSFLKLGAGAAAVLAVAGGGLALFRPGLSEGQLTVGGREVFTAIARAVLDGSLPEDAAQRADAVRAHLQRLDDALGAFPPAVQAELSQLLSILAAAPGRVALAGLYLPWHEASVVQIQASLQGMRTSSLSLKQQAYHALRDLTNAAYYADAQAWRVMGYPGQRVV